MEQETVEEEAVEEEVEEAPIETSEGCANDDSVSDSYGDTCTDWYNTRPETCGDYDTEDFTAAISCCMCQWDDLST